MGDVYLATDTKLHRRVAIKFLSTERAADSESRLRFIHEARTQAMLNHPNIATCYEVGEFEGRAFIVMEYIEGGHLADVFAPDEQSLAEILEVMIQLGEGLQAAHEHDVTHRDVKPENIMITSKGRVKITDFGLAHWKGAARLSRDGTWLGTVSYMSPEQADGKRVDHRSDIFSAGIVLYELITGRLPFRGDHEPVTIYSILNESPEPLARYRAEVSDGLQRITTKCLAKSRDERYQSCADLVADLKLEHKELTATVPAAVSSEIDPEQKSPWRRRQGMLFSATAVAVVAFILLIVGPWRLQFIPIQDVSAARKMLAVLPFENLGADSHGYFADGITEEITIRLSRISDVGIIAHSSVMQYKETTVPIKKIGRDLGVDYILQGTIRWQESQNGPDRVRIMPQLIRVGDATNMWGEVYDEVLTEVFAVQSDVAEKVASALNLSLVQSEHREINRRPTENLIAYDYYLQGSAHFNRGLSKSDLLSAVELFDQAVENDSGFVEAYARLASAHARLYFIFGDRGEHRKQLAQEAAERAIAVGPNLPEALMARGAYRNMIKRDYGGALTDFSKARKSLANNSELIHEIALVQMRQGHWNAARENFEMAVTLDPLSVAKNASLAHILVFMRDYPAAERAIDRAIALGPNQPELYHAKAQLSLLRDGDLDKARSIIGEAAEFVDPPEIMWRAGSRPNVLWTLWRFQLIEQEPAVIREEFAQRSEDMEKRPFYLSMAQLCELAGDPDGARAYYDSVRVILQESLDKQPDEFVSHAEIGLAYAYLGLKDRAVAHASRAIELMPVSSCHW
jgi:TolB-like protein/Flp pilus assembly protein TadD/predicted Ser/Thr protein kinase